MILYELTLKLRDQMSKKKLTKNEILKECFQTSMNRVLEEKKKETSDTFWYPRCVELLEAYKAAIKEKMLNIDGANMDDLIIAFAHDAYSYAFKQR